MRKDSYRGILSGNDGEPFGDERQDRGDGVGHLVFLAAFADESSDEES